MVTKINVITNLNSTFDAKNSGVNVAFVLNKNVRAFHKHISNHRFGNAGFALYGILGNGTGLQTFKDVTENVTY